MEGVKRRNKNKIGGFVATMWWMVVGISEEEQKKQIGGNIMSGTLNMCPVRPEDRNLSSLVIMKFVTYFEICFQ